MRDLGQAWHGEGQTVLDENRLQVAQVCVAEDVALIVAAPEMRAAIDKWVQWCSDEIIRGQWGNPRLVLRYILEEARAILASIDAEGR